MTDLEAAGPVAISLSVIGPQLDIFSVVGLSS